MSAFQGNAFQNNAFQSRIIVIPTGVGTREMIVAPHISKIFTRAGGPVSTAEGNIISTGGKKSFSAGRRQRFTNRG